MPTSQHLVEITKNRSDWRRKPLLREIYAGFYGMIKDRLVDGPTLELGSGIGQIRDHLPDCITSDVHPGPGIDRVESAYHLSFETGELGNLILLDVFHHLRHPASALAAFRRVLRPGGRVVILDPAMGVIPRAIYGLFHHEPLGWRDPIEWRFPREEPAWDTGYFAAQARAWRIFMRQEGLEEIAGFKVLECIAWSDFAYLASGGFSKPAFFPCAWLRGVQAVDRLLSSISPSLFAARMIVVLERQPA